MTSTRKLLVGVALGVVLTCGATFLWLSAWLDSGVPSNAAELEDELHERERYARERALAAIRRDQEQLELQRLADRLRAELAAEQGPKADGN